MTIRRRASGAWTTVAAVKAKKTGAQATVGFVRRRLSGAWVDANATNINASVSPTAVTGYTTGGVATKSVTSGTATVTATGGSGAAKTYSWARVSGGTVTITSPSAAATTFSASLSAAPGAIATLDAVYRCTVTDGTFTDTVDVTIHLEYERDP